MNKDLLLQELKFRAVRSGGAGGQHVNKVSTKVELSLNLGSSRAFNESEKERLYKKLNKRLTSENKLLVQCDESRSQHKNREIAEDRMLKLIEEALKVPKKRKKTSPSKASVEKRLKTKRVVAMKKTSRQKPEDN
ncbi:alternative ribosome rescue aminoacyl-tRNA hydrolase ArfB [uncultured Eudoraea sp.]|uniref:alternative ribosome rescue aminoacyl-tRNA hydrolase ArfB n=1 Tax=uncultured Eudoraea sp. TaxID=1035614 RepID=UPI002626C0AE|nr:alternative ribosome rescue aminoacyl-tRNA hydrolase ArfB [uncultured Eudoraea sp.]